MLIPKEAQLTAVVMEFKVRNANSKKLLENTEELELKQISDKHYDAELFAVGISTDVIRHQVLQHMLLQIMIIMMIF